MPLGARLWLYADELRTLSVAYPLCGSALTDTTYNLSEMGPLKLTDFCLFMFHQSYTILQGLRAYSPNSFHKLLGPGLEPATQRWESQHFNHAATLTCLCTVLILTSFTSSTISEVTMFYYTVAIIGRQNAHILIAL